MKKLFLLLLLILGLACGHQSDPFIKEKHTFLKAEQNGKLANKAFRRCQRFVEGWLQHADPETGLIPKNLEKDKDIWNAKDAAADNYPFMVLTASLLDRDLFNGRMLQMLKTEEQLTSRLGKLPDTYSFSKRTFADPEVDIQRLIFGGSEYIKDGLLPLTEWLGPSPWSQRMVGILDDIWHYAPIETSYGNLPSTSQEVNGEMLQALSRIYWMTGNRKYLDYAIRLADYYLFDQHPTRDETRLRLRDHGCEILSGLTEVYAAVHFAAPEKKQAYHKPIHLMLDRVLEVGRNEHGMFYNWVNPQTGEHDDKLCDTWGYNYNGFYTVYLIDEEEKYRQAAIHVLSNLNENYLNYNWENDSADGYADAIESALNLLNREPVPSAAQWIDHQTRILWNKQREDGVIEGWHGDGNFARTSIMYALWKTQGLTIQPWREDVIFGAELKNGTLYIIMKATSEWHGKLVFDQPRHQLNLNLPIDYPRINQFPQWFTIEENGKYSIATNLEKEERILNDEDLSMGFAIDLHSDQRLEIILKKM